ncbi:hypothetical protein F5Y11DRAFT_349836 [Daldinia sp. FL1419]|nr:hypothetical protein F5Y11DRAFT_349836 [Daldinia sp. FL1419]
MAKPEEQFPCYLCGEYSTSNHADLAQHILYTHMGVKCLFARCDFHATSDEDLLSHINDAHQEIHLTDDDYLWSAANPGNIFNAYRPTLLIDIITNATATIANSVNATAHSITTAVSNTSATVGRIATSATNLVNPFSSKRPLKRLRESDDVEEQNQDEQDYQEEEDDYKPAPKRRRL